MTAAHDGTPPAEGGLLVAMLTYRRPDDLGVALPGFLAELDSWPGPGPARLLVVDNDPDGSAEAQVREMGDDRVRYVHEPRPGIAAGRNRALDEADRADLLIFVDDDEVPVDGWLTALLDVHRRTGAACVVGPVVSEYLAPPDPWLLAGRFFDRRRLPTGTPVTVAATNNLLLDLRSIRPSGLRFDEAFGLSGGSDTLFTRTLARAGTPMVWCDEAVVLDRVPVDRLTRGWVLRRARRMGNSASRVEVALAGPGVTGLRVRAAWTVRGAVRVVAGTARWGAGVLLRTPAHAARGRRSLERGLGMVGGAVGHVVYEYRRS